jgi:AcrR family transcriptional regulator
MGPEKRRKAILGAGLAVFAEDGFAAAKLEDVAAKAGIAKGTIYLYFDDKQDLFEQIVRDAVAPVLARLQGVAAMPDLPTDTLLAQLFELFRNEILGTNRRLVTRLVLTEGARFPKIAAFYHREVIAKGLELIKLVAQRGVARGEIAPNGLERFPHLVFAPLLLTLLWEGLFSKFDPLDVEGLLATHRKFLTVAPGDRRPSP